MEITFVEWLKRAINSVNNAIESVIQQIIWVYGWKVIIFVLRLMPPEIAHNTALHGLRILNKYRPIIDLLWLVLLAYLSVWVLSAWIVLRLLSYDVNEC